MPISSTLHTALTQQIATAKTRVLGEDLLKNDAEARLLLSVLQAYGADPTAFLYISPTRARSTHRPPDLVLCHPAVGLLIIEAKGHPITAIQGLEAGHLFVTYANRPQPVNVLQQADEQLYEIEGDLLRLLPDRRAKPLLTNLIAFPNITTTAWRARGYHQAFPCNQLLFQDQIADPLCLRQHIQAVVSDALLQARRATPLDPHHVEAIARVFGNSAALNPTRAIRPQVEAAQLGAYIDELATETRYLSDEQKQLVRITIDGAPRLIRGVAGSGKSIVLAELVARYLKHQLPNADALTLPQANLSIAVTCFNQTLVAFLKTKVETAYQAHFPNATIPSNILLITHLNQLLWVLIKQRGWPLTYIAFKDLPDPVARAQAYRTQIAAFAAHAPQRYHALCLDALFIDEGQDFEPIEYQLLLDLLKPHPQTGEKTLVTFYDDAQNLYGHPRPVWRDLGLNLLGERSRVMRTCYRNSRQIVELAFNVLLGAQAPADQRVQTRTYADVAYLKEHGLIEETADHFLVHFAIRDDQPPLVKAFPHHTAEIDWVAAELIRLLRTEAVRPEDILLLAMQPTRLNLVRLKQQLRAALPTLRFREPATDPAHKQGHLLQPGQLTIATVAAAKGYDAPIVFILGAEHFRTDRRGRATFYVAATRAKLRLYLTGVTTQSAATPSLLTEAQSIAPRLQPTIPP